MTDTIVDEERTGALSTQPRPPTRPGGRGPIPVLRQGWRQLTSMRTALLLLALLALAAIPGTVIPQRGLDPVKVDTFLTNHPHLGPLMDHLSLFDVFAAPWFAAIYLLLAISLIGCLVPRIRLHARALRRRPPKAPRQLLRLTASTQWHADEAPEALAQRVHALLRDHRWRADLHAEPDGAFSVAAEKGYLRESGNLLFHVSLLVLLVGIALAGLYGYKGTVLVTKGGGFANAQESYDVFQPARLFSASQLAPFSFTLQDFTATYQSNGEPTTFNAHIHYKTSPSAPAQPYDIEVNHPLDIDGAKLFLVGHGYSLNISVTNAAGVKKFSGQVPFLPDDSNFTSHGVVKVPDLGNGQLGLTGFFYPTYGQTLSGPASIFPAVRNPVLAFAAWKGNLGLNSGVPQSVYSLPVTGLTHIGTRSLVPGQSWHLKDGATVTFHGVDQWATFQIAHEPGKRTVLVAAVCIIAGLLGSLRIRRRRFWLRAAPATRGGADPTPSGDTGPRTVVTAAGLARSDVDGFAEELHELVGRIGRPPEHGDVSERD